MARESFLSRLMGDYATLLVLALLSAGLSVATIAEQHPSGAAAGRQVAARIAGDVASDGAVLIVVRDTPGDADFAAAAAEELERRGLRVLETVRGQPADARRALVRAAERRQPLAAIVVNEATGRWGVFDSLPERYPTLGAPPLVAPASYRWPNFLKTGNLLNITNQVADIAIVAIGMTMVIVAGGIDLSVGSLIAFAAIVMATLVRDLCGGTQASAGQVLVCGAATLAACGMVGAASGTLVTWFRIPPFIVTLGVMSIASGVAYIISEGETIDQLPAGIGWLGRGAALFGIPNAVVLMLLLYAVSDVVMKRTVFGRHLYAVGGNRQAAFLCGVPVKRVILATYVASAVLAGLAGLMQVSLFQSGKPSFGRGYELQVIAAVVVGGTSLSGGEGKMIGTLLGALIIAVVQNGMNLLGIGGQWQPVVLGGVILAAALLDSAKRRGREP